MEKELKSNRFCHDILKSGIKRARALCNLMMAMSSYESARSVVQLSLSPLYHYQYSSVFKVIHDIVDDGNYKEVQQKVQSVCMNYYEDCSSTPYVLQTDSSSVLKPHSPTLKDRMYVCIANKVIADNKPIGVGYDVSYINVSDYANSSWSMPLSIERIGKHETSTQRAQSQLKSLLTHPDLGLNDRLVVNTLDSKYGNAAYLAPVYKHDNLVSVARLRQGIRVWTRYEGPQSRKGQTRVYGQKYYLNNQTQHKTFKNPRTKESIQVVQESIFDLAADDYVRLSRSTKKGRAIHVDLWRWNNVMLRSKNGHDMRNKPLDIVCIRFTDAQRGKRLFKKDMFVCVHGQSKSDVSTVQAYEYYRHRYDIEPYFRFAKQRLLLSKYQALDERHFDNWLLIQQLCSWLLYTASDETCAIPHKWEQYLRTYKTKIQNGLRLSITKTFRAAQKLFLTFDQQVFKPLKSNKGSGRKKGQTQTPRTQYKVVRKQTNSNIHKLKMLQLE